MPDVTEERAGSIVDHVLDRHGIAVDDEQRSRIVWELQWICSARDNFERETQLEAHDEHRKRLDRIAALESVLAAYDDLRQRSEQFQTNDLRALSSGKTDVTAVLSDLRALLESERELAALSEPAAIPNRAPTTTKHVGTPHIFAVLREVGVSTWNAARVIAELLIDAGIESRPIEKSARSLYDKFKRI